jgi:hypothetical protein
MRKGRFAFLAVMAISIMPPFAPARSNVSPRNSLVHDDPAGEKRDYKRDSRINRKEAIKRKEARMNRKDREMDRLMRQRKLR